MPDDLRSVLVHGYQLSDTVDAFVRAVYEYGFDLEEFDWPSWMRTPEAEQLRDDPAVLAQATLEQLQHPLTVCIRQDRFITGSLAGHFESGLLASILRRAAVLVRAADACGEHRGSPEKILSREVHRNRDQNQASQALSRRPVY